MLSEMVLLAGRSYPVLIGDDLLAKADALIAASLGVRRCIVITDENVAQHALPRLPQMLCTVPPIILPAGEAAKSFATLELLCSKILEMGIDRKTILVALGGGVIGDLVGFAASILLRGLDFVQIPTSLLAQVDSSVGGKTGINLPLGKNLVGAFHQPRLVLCDMTALKTLPARELRAGYAEVLKYGLIADAQFFDWCDSNLSGLLAMEPELLPKAVQRSVQHKANIVAADETETKDLRALLNLGHTFGHALEAEALYDGRLVHGEAVALGCCLAFDLSVRLRFCMPEAAQRVRAHMENAGLPFQLKPFGFAAEKLLQHMRRDKKTENGQLTFILVKGIGQAFVARNIEAEDVLATLNAAA